MMSIKRVIEWEPRATNKRDKAGKEIENDFHGVFRTKVDASTPGAIHYSGVVDGKPWEYYAKEATTISGWVRWVDKVLPSFTGATTKLVMYVESEKALHKITMDYDAGTLRDVMNNVCGMKKGIPTNFVNLTYWVRKKLDSNKNPVMTPKGKFRLLRNIQFQDNTPKFTYEEWRDFAADNGLDWAQTKNAKGETSWNTDAELKYWDSMIVEVQRFLLKSGTALPFTYGSLIACEATNPSGGGNLTTAEIETAKQRYEEVKAGYRFAFQTREVVDADSVLDEYVPPAATVAQQGVAAGLPPGVEEDDFPTSDVTSYAETADTDELPF